MSEFYTVTYVGKRKEVVAHVLYSSCPVLKKQVF